MTELDAALERAAQPKERRTALDLIESMRPEVERSLQDAKAADILTRHYFTAIRFNELLRQCSPESVVGALLLTAQVRLEPGPLGHVYLVPFRNSAAGTFEVNWMLGYTGIIELGRRGGAAGLRATVVWGDDVWSGIKNVNGNLRYTLEPSPERAEDAERIGVLVEWREGADKQALWCPPSRIDTALAHRRAKDKSVATADWYWRKTGVRFARPFLPLTTELATAVSADDGVVRGVEVDDTQAIAVLDAPELEHEVTTDG